MGLFFQTLLLSTLLNRHFSNYAIFTLSSVSKNSIRLLGVYPSVNTIYSLLLLLLLIIIIIILIAIELTRNISHTVEEHGNRAVILAVLNKLKKKKES